MRSSSAQQPPTFSTSFRLHSVSQIPSLSPRPVPATALSAPPQEIYRLPRIPQYTSLDASLPLLARTAVSSRPPSLVPPNLAPPYIQSSSDAVAHGLMALRPASARPLPARMPAQAFGLDLVPPRSFMAPETAATLDSFELMAIRPSADPPGVYVSDPHPRSDPLPSVKNRKPLPSGRLNQSAASRADRLQPRPDDSTTFGAAPSLPKHAFQGAELMDGGLSPPIVKSDVVLPRKLPIPSRSPGHASISGIDGRQASRQLKEDIFPLYQPPGRVEDARDGWWRWILDGYSKDHRQAQDTVVSLCKSL